MRLSSQVYLSLHVYRRQAQTPPLVKLPFQITARLLQASTNPFQTLSNPNQTKVYVVLELSEEEAWLACLWKVNALKFPLKRSESF